MPDTYDYPAEIEHDEAGRYVVAFPDFGWGAADGASRGEALAEARDLLRELIAATIREGKDLPQPSRATKRRPLVVPPVPIALKAASTSKLSARPACRNAISPATSTLPRARCGACSIRITPPRPPRLTAPCGG